eukprot:m.52913 g.52913  ORF g.52913 m.52913 type:complete len:475 (+) comp21675_c1_seq2:191-1615(+)
MAEAEHVDDLKQTVASKWQKAERKLMRLNMAVTSFGVDHVLVAKPKPSTSSKCEEVSPGKHRILPVPPKVVPEAKHPHAAEKKKDFSNARMNSHAPLKYKREARSKRHEGERARFEEKLKLAKASYKSKNTVDNFDIDRVLGEGAFGRVVAVQNQDPNSDAPSLPNVSDEMLAVKALSLQHICDLEQQEHLYNEKNLLFAMDSRFCCKMFDYMIDDENVYFVMQLVNGGDLTNLLSSQPEENGKPKPLPHAQAQFYLAQVVLAFDYIHSLHIVHRDLKPENLLLTYQGNVLLTDFGVAKRLDIHQKTFTFCGTMEYVAPEIITNRGHDEASDWWSFGVLCYELMCGASQTPFVSDHRCAELHVFSKVLAAKYQFPKHLSTVQKFFIGSFLMVDVTRRLGSMHGGVSLVQQQPYFKGINWDALQNGTAQTPYRPPVENEWDLSNIPEESSWKFEDMLSCDGDFEPGSFEGAFDHF